MKRNEAKSAMMELAHSRFLNSYYTEALSTCIDAMKAQRIPDENVFINTKAVDAEIVERTTGDLVSLNCTRCGVKVRKHFRYCWYCGAIFTNGGWNNGKVAGEGKEE